ncbi:hypothetical protein AB833_23280 [Chromatiales bacterium (ex Bugula neritina AB1)]|nr:hypothetical protein AB833_23280 [Chromatiales bacterium (ex Bugula neritina AB1)]
MVDFARVKAIDFHTHAEEPCNECRDDGYNEFQTGMVAYFGLQTSPTCQMLFSDTNAELVAEEGAGLHTIASKAGRLTVRQHTRVITQMCNAC